jgi:hypothetical protein
MPANPRAATRLRAIPAASARRGLRGSAPDDDGA